MEDKRVIEKIRNLLTKSRDAGTSEAEAQACAAKARKLMDEYGMSEDSVRERGAEPAMEEWKVRDTETWRTILGGAVSRYYGCMFVSMTEYARGGREVPVSYVIIGQETSRLVAKDMYDYLQDAVERLSYIDNVENGRTWHEMHHFRRECGKRVADRLKDALEAIKMGAQMTGGAGSGGAVVVLTELQKSRAWMQANMRTTRNKLATRGLGDAGAAGRAAGDTVSFADQVGGESGGRRGRPLAIGGGS